MNGSQGRQLIYLLLTISGTVLTQQANWQLQMRHLHWPVLASMLIAFGAGAPLFLLMRERHLQQLDDANG